jgi:ABC-type phosphate transport system permease subunit
MRLYPGHVPYYFFIITMLSVDSATYTIVGALAGLLLIIGVVVVATTDDLDPVDPQRMRAAADILHIPRPAVEEHELAQRFPPGHTIA